MTSIMTVLGPCSPSEIGITSTHEHLFAESSSDRHDPDCKLDRLDTITEELLAFREAGGDAIVEVTSLDMGRDVVQLARAAAGTGVKIIASTGFYKGNYAPSAGEVLHTWSFLPEELRAASVDQLAATFMREVRDGVAGTNAKVGMIGEIGTSYGQILEEEEKVFRAAARTNRETGVPISTHTTLGTMGREQIEILKQEGADLGHVVICHLDLIPDTAYHIQLASQGVFLGFDTVGKEQYQSDSTRVELIQRMVKEGFEDHIVLGCDIGRRSEMKRQGGRGYAYLLNSFVPRLEAAGIDRATTHKFLVENPRRLLAF